MNPMSRGKRILSLLSQDTCSTAVPIESCSNNSNFHVTDNEDDEDDNLFGGDDSDADKNYEPTSGESSESDENDVRPRGGSEKNKKIVIKPMESEGTAVQDVFAEDLHLSSAEDGNPEKNAKRKVKNKTSCTQPGKKRVVHASDWSCNVRKRKIAGGKEYLSKKGKVIPAKVMKAPCNCRMKCSEKLKENERQNIFDSYWSEENSTDVKRQFIFSCVEKHSAVRSRKRDPHSTKSKDYSLLYYFSVNSQRLKVCKVMFLNTLSISNTVVVNTLKKVQPGGLIKRDQRGRHTPSNKSPEETINSVKQHISAFPQYESHYSREKSERKYLGPELTIEKIAKKWLYTDIFNKQFKLSFKPPEIDTCDTCDMFNAKIKNNMLQEEKERAKVDHDAHLNEAKKRYDLKRTDTTMAKSSPKHKVLTGDLQKCLPSPLTTNCISFYKRKLWTLNFTLYDSADGSVACMMWDESKGARGGNEIASSILEWANSTIPGSEVEEITLWTDNCYGQNKNISVVMSFFWILHTYPQIKTITQKFLLKGHTHMEADSVHALIERKRKKLNNFAILTPWDWQQVVRQTSSKYTVHNMELSNFKSFNTLFDRRKHANPPFVNRKKDVNKEPVLLSTCVQLQVHQEKIGTLFLKTDFNGEAQEIDFVRFRRRDITFPANLNQVSTNPIPISIQKYNDLLALLPFVPSVCHDFYKNLVHSNQAIGDYPQGDDDVDPQ
nr:unnamed protein product [Callosobruchus chinensis]